MKNNDKKGSPTYIGGQAIIEGVMMRGKTLYTMAVRKPDGQIELVKKLQKPVSEKYPLLKLPIIRGMVSFVDSLVIGVKTISESAELSGMTDFEDEEPSKFEAFLTKKFGDKLNDYMIYFSVFLSIVLAVALFILLPTVLGSLFNTLLKDNTWALGIVEGFVRIGVFLLYLYLISLSKDIKRLYQYHGAEHKTINCFESSAEMSVESVKKHSRLHKRCGTSFMFIVMLISMIVFIFVRTDAIWLRLLSRVLLLPVIAGMSYEAIRWAGRSDSVLVTIVSFPGMCIQRLTTAEPDDKQIEVAISAMKGVLDSESGHS